MAHTMKKFDVSETKSEILSSINSLANELKFLNNLKTADEFIKSKNWELMEPTDGGHDTIYHYFKQLFKEQRVMISDKGVSTHDDHELFTELSRDEKDFINAIDSKKEFGIYKYGRLHCMYIGTVCVISNGYTFESDHCRISGITYSGYFTGAISTSSPPVNKTYQGSITGSFGYRDNTGAQISTKLKYQVGTITLV